MKTQADLIVCVLGLLNVAQVGQDPAPEDFELIKGHIDGKFEELARRQILYVQNPDAIDDEYFLPLAKIVANAAAPQYGMPFSAETDDREEWRLRDINRRPAIYPVTAAEFF